MSNPGEEIAIEAAKAAAVAIVTPAQEIVADVLGGLIGDHLSNWRKSKPAWQERNRRETAERAARVLEDRGVTKAADNSNPAEVERIIEASKDISDPDLREIFARLVAAAMDPNRIQFYRREFLTIAGTLDPIDALVLQKLDISADLAPSRKEAVAKQISRHPAEVELAFRNLERLELIYTDRAGSPQRYPTLVTLGKQFLAAVR